MAGLFEIAARRVRDSYIVILLFLASLLVLVIGINQFYEDFLSSYYGLQYLQSSYGLTLASWSGTFIAMSLLPQVFQVVLAYLGLSDFRKNAWAWGVFLIFWVIDTFSDVFYRSNTHMFDSFQTFSMSMTMTIVFYTFGSELCISVGSGLVLNLVAPFIVQVRKIFSELGKAMQTYSAPPPKDSLQHSGKIRPMQSFQSSGNLQPSSQYGQLFDSTKRLPPDQREVVFGRLKQDIRDRLKHDLKQYDRQNGRLP